MREVGGVRRVRATVYDVAERAGVSIKTVSRVVNGDQAVTEATRQRVLESVRALSYQPNAAARSLRIGVADAIGLVLDSIADPWFAQLTAAVEERALAAGMTVLIASTGRDRRLLRGQIERLVQQQVCGLLVAPLGNEADLLPDVMGGLPAVFFDRQSNVPEIDVVRVADRAAARQAVEHLIAHGHRRIAFFGDNRSASTIRLRRQGYRDALRANGIDIDEGIIIDNCGDHDSAEAATRKLLATRSDVTAYFASNPRSAVAIVSVLHKTANTDLALISFGDFPLATVIQPAVTVVDHDPRHIGLAAADLLLERISGVSGMRRDVHMPTHLLLRGSGELSPRL